MFDRKKHWESIYAEKSPAEVSWYQKEPLVSLSLIRNTGVDHDAAVIDVGGGASVLVDYLLDDGFSNLSVLDISAHAISYARQRLGEKADSVSWHEQDVTCFEPPQPYAVWHDRAVFHFLTGDADRRDYVKVLRNAVLPGGQVIIAAFAVGGPTKCSGLDIVQYDADKLAAELDDGFELAEEKDELHLTPANAEQQFSYFRFNKK